MIEKIKEQINKQIYGIVEKGQYKTFTYPVVI